MKLANKRSEPWDDNGNTDKKTEIQRQWQRERARQENLLILAIS